MMRVDLDFGTANADQVVDVYFVTVELRVFLVVLMAVGRRGFREVSF